MESNTVTVGAKAYKPHSQTIVASTAGARSNAHGERHGATGDKLQQSCSLESKVLFGRVFVETFLAT